MLIELYAVVLGIYLIWIFSMRCSIPNGDFILSKVKLETEE